MFSVNDKKIFSMISVMKHMRDIKKIQFLIAKDILYRNIY